VQKAFVNYDEIFQGCECICKLSKTYFRGASICKLYFRGENIIKTTLEGIRKVGVRKFHKTVEI